jgi:hypothetical protein
MTTPPHPKNIGRRRRLIDINGKHLYVKVEDEIVRPQHNAKNEKLIYLQKLRHESDRRLEYRFTYYMKGSKGRMKGRWVFGQYSLMIPATDLKRILAEARKKHWAGF